MPRLVDRLGALKVSADDLDMGTSKYGPAVGANHLDLHLLIVMKQATCEVLVDGRVDSSRLAIDSR